MSRFDFSPTAQQDVLEIFGYIARDNPEAARRHVQRFEAACQFLADNPQSGTARDDLLPQLRAWSVGNYVIFFRPVEGGIDVARVVHGARDYGRLFDQLP